MANIKSSKKRAQIAERNRVRNQAYKSAIRTAIKKVHQALTAKQGNPTDVLNQAFGLLDSAVFKGILHKRTVARTKSRLQLAANKQVAA